MTRFEEYQLLFYQKELEKKEKMIEELICENRVLARANLKLKRKSIVRNYKSQILFYSNERHKANYVC